MNKKWFLLLLIVPILFLYFKKNNYPQLNLSEPVTGRVEINTGSTPKQISKISCWVFNYPIKQRTEIDLSKSKSIIFKNGLKQPIICDALIDNQWWPIHWSLPIKNLEGNGFKTKAISFEQPIVNVNSWMINANNGSVLATSDEVSKNAHQVIDFQGQYRMKQLPSQNIYDEYPLCESCPKQTRNNNLYFLDKISLPNEKNISTALFAIWYDAPFYYSCGETMGITSEQVFKGTGLKVSDARLAPFAWDSQFQDGWKNDDAIALRPWYHCTFNQATLKWQCGNDFAQKEVAPLIAKAEKCNITKDLLVKEQCQHEYFANKIFLEANSCVNRTFVNLGGPTASVPVDFPTAKGLSLVQRAIALDDTTLSMQREVNLIKPTMNGKELIPCQLNLSMTGIMKKLPDTKILSHIQIRVVVNDHKKECVHASEDFPNLLNTIFMGEKE